ncbi:hypothetical protein BGZ96_002555 [Linnemannia gamsii]|uniref:RNI-like protein n=1 Tax=Linnemannia gamsii TaxID=64522 RepID=A0ABQ7K978_9FUNG|nr:hypothetical protein BGZ96_002555 [Linnemannia gamsii]
MSYSSGMLQTHALDLHEIRSKIASFLCPKDLPSCVRVSQDWNASFTPSLYSSVVLSVVLLEHGPSIESINRNKQLIRHLKITSAYVKLSTRKDKVVSIIVANSTLTTLDLSFNSIEDDGAKALAKALKTNSTLTTLELSDNMIGGNGAQALAEALKTNSTLTTFDWGSIYD